MQFAVLFILQPAAGVIGAGSVPSKSISAVGLQKIRESLMLQYIFNEINTKKDTILSLDELLDLASKVDVFLTEDEARKGLAMMDLDGDDRLLYFFVINIYYFCYFLIY